MTAPLDPALDGLCTDLFGWLDHADLPGSFVQAGEALGYETWARSVRIAGEIRFAPARDAALWVLAEVRRAQVPRSCNSLDLSRLERKEASRR